jgi:hypothetical protein
MIKVRGYSWISRTADLSKMQTNRGSAAHVRCSISPAQRGALPIRDCCKSPTILRIRARPTLIKSGLNKL